MIRFFIAIDAIRCHILYMSKRLVKLINQIVIKEGVKGKLRLALAIGKGERMIDRYRKGTCNPSQKDAYDLALACGCSNEDALKIAEECHPLEARESA